MTPALSVVFFTTASGAGYGLLALTGFLASCGLTPASPWFGLVAVGLALALASSGLVSSTLHLGHPERAWRAVRQWRSSWLSCEGLAALLTYPPALAFVAAWFLARRPDAVMAAFGVLAAALAIATVFCTAMIYVSLRPVRQWRNVFVTPNFLLLASFSGALWLAPVAQLFHAAAVLPSALALSFGAAALGVKLAYWRVIDCGSGESTIETATGLGRLGRVRALEAPHTEENYLLREMGFRIARKYARRLRTIVVVLGFALPLVLTAVAVASPALPAVALAIVAATAALAGIFVERWLFFAEATHTVVLYYGRAA
ncbi:MAG: dimethyl sulfoxide reductase anchor subunit [Rhodospirillales bacterium]|nr:dimethyl sulfoxide reductase anchor subunit [Rhodospirillales bacterium]